MPLTKCKPYMLARRFARRLHQAFMAIKKNYVALKQLRVKLNKLTS